jgi:hypothetical protein
VYCVVYNSIHKGPIPRVQTRDFGNVLQRAPLELPCLLATDVDKDRAQEPDGPDAKENREKDKRNLVVASDLFKGLVAVSNVCEEESPRNNKKRRRDEECRRRQCDRHLFVQR